MPVRSQPTSPSCTAFTVNLPKPDHSDDHPSRGICLVVEATYQLLYRELKAATSASERDCRLVAERLAAEVDRICQESKRIQASGEVRTWEIALARHRLKQCLGYYRLGSKQGRVELHSTLSAVIYRYIAPPQSRLGYQARCALIDDFLQSFYIEAFNAFRRETGLGPEYSPRTLLELAEYMAFVERYGKRRIPLPGRRSQQLIILRAQTFSQQQPPETAIDIEQATEASRTDGAEGSNWLPSSAAQVREQMTSIEPDSSEDSLRDKVVEELLAYLEKRGQTDCADYFALRLKDLPTAEIEEILGLTPRQRDYLQQRFKYHLIRFALSHRWELVHQWLEADLERNLGLTSRQWQEFTAVLGEDQTQILDLKREKLADDVIARKLGCTVNQLQKKWFHLLEQAWEIRNNASSGTEAAVDE
ncbi:heterocyst differentiation protein HetZ [Leptolyngbya sp. FACHB-261]|nr:heterocyst differentiation protein HetZ [Leptolyngbya sp. FACHB-261]